MIKPGKGNPSTLQRWLVGLLIGSALLVGLRGIAKDVDFNGSLLRQAFGAMPHPDRGLLIARRFYDALGGHGGGAGGDVALMRTIGRRRIAILPAGVVRRARDMLD